MTRESAMRVFYMRPELVEAWRKVRDKQEVITHDFITEACDKFLPVIEREAKQMGLIATPGDERVPVRLEIALATLAALSDVSEVTGIPATQLLSMVLGRVSSQRRKPAKK